jgi:hypothetical protein
MVAFTKVAPLVKLDFPRYAASCCALVRNPAEVSNLRPPTLLFANSNQFQMDRN